MLECRLRCERAAHSVTLSWRLFQTQRLRRVTLFEGYKPIVIDPTGVRDATLGNTTTTFLSNKWHPSCSSKQLLAQNSRRRNALCQIRWMGIMTKVKDCILRILTSCQSNVPCRLAHSRHFSEVCRESRDLLDKWHLSKDSFRSNSRFLILGYSFEAGGNEVRLCEIRFFFFSILWFIGV